MYTNPIARGGDFADPFVLRFNGVYYLYATNPDVRCWTSVDLITWDLVGATVPPDAFPGLVPFAPEVVYDNGLFYMYTSPSGLGHYVLSSESPTGPFQKITGNVAHSIDGNVFIDDDGQWYFYWAGDEGIWGCPMTSPTEFGEPILTGIFMNGWTEGPFVTKRHGRYHMTLTGNHYLSRGYRIDAAVSNHPLRGWRGDALNPAVVKTEGSVTGLGHSSSVRGPDLVSTYITYHNLNPDASRDLNIDRQIMSDRTLQVLGPSSSAPVPSAPDAVWSGSLSPTLGPTATAELNLIPRRASDGYGLVFESPTGDEIIALRVDPAKASVIASVHGAERARAALPVSFVHEALHCWRIVVKPGELTLALDCRHQFTVALTDPHAFRIRLLGDVQPGHCAATGATEVERDSQAVAPVPGRFWATLSPDATDHLSESPDVTYRSVALPAGERLEYRLHPQRDLEPFVHFTGEFAVGDELEVHVDEDRSVVHRVSEAGRVVRVVLPNVAAASAARPVRTLTVAASAGNPTLTLVTVTDAVDIGSEAHLGPLRASGFQKCVVGEGDYGDLTMSAEFSVDARTGGHGDLLLRASELAEGGEGNDTQLGIDFMLSYSVQLHADRVVIARHSYDERVLAVCQLRRLLAPGALHQLAVRAVGSRLAVQLDGESVLDVDDVLPLVLGRVGIRAVNADLTVHELHVQPNDMVHR